MIPLAKEDSVEREYIFREDPPFETRRMNCCGIVELSSTLSVNEYRKEDFIEWLKRFATKGENGIPLWNGKIKKAGILLATTTPAQRKYISWLKEVGFVQGETFLNYNTRRRVTMWTFSLKEVR